MLLHRALGPGWIHDHTSDQLIITHTQHGTPYRPSRRFLTPLDVLNLISDAFAEHGIRRDNSLPLWWRDETELTVAAIQALDPWLKHDRNIVLRSGFLAQPVVRLTAARDSHGRLRDGFATAFVNTALVTPITDLDQVSAVLDVWISVLGRVGLHARHLRLQTDLRLWQRRQVRGLTIRCKHDDIGIGDLVALWNTDDPSRLAIDLGSGLERITWARCRRAWSTIIHGQLAALASTEALDTLRTVALLLGHGISPAPRGPGSITRRLLHTVPIEAIQLGASTAVRHYHAYWNSITPLTTPWPDIDLQIEQEVANNQMRHSQNLPDCHRCPLR